MKTNQDEVFNNDFDFNNDSAGVISLSDILNTGKSQDEEIEDDVVDSEKELENAVESLIKEKEVKEDIEASDDATVEDEVTKEIKEETVTESPIINYKSVIKNVFGEELGAITQIDEETGEEVEIPFDELDIDEDLFTQLVNSKIEEVKEQNKDKVSVDNFSNFTKTLINIEKTGGNIQQALDLYNNFQNPLESLDLEVERDQAEAVYLRFKGENYEDDVIEDLIESYKTKGVLKQKGLEAKEELEKAVSENLKAIEEQSEKREEDRKKALREYKANLKQEISNLKVKDSLKNRIVESATKQGSDNTYELDKLYNEIRKDPKRVGELALFLLDKDEYIKEITKEVVTEDRKSTLKKIRLIPSKGKSVNPKERKGSDGDTISLDEFLK